MAKAMMDKYSNLAYGLVTMSAANTLTYSQIQMGVGLFQGIAMVLHRVRWWPTPAALREMATGGDSMHCAITTSNRLTEITDVNEPAVIASYGWVGVGANVEPQIRPVFSEFTSLPGGGKLIPANPLWIAMVSQGFVAAGAMRAHLEFSFVELGSDEYLELLQSQYPANIS